MGKSSSLNGLLAMEAVAVLALAFFAWKYHSSAAVLTYQTQTISGYEKNVEALNQLIREADAYSQQNPEINKVLVKIGAKTPAAATPGKR